MTHRMTVNRDKEAVLLLHDQVTRVEIEGYKEFDGAELDIQKMKKSGIFSDIIVFDSFLMREHGVALADEEFLSLFDEKMLNIGVDLKSFDEFYTTNEPDFDFSRYLSLKHIKATWIEPVHKEAQKNVEVMRIFNQKVVDYIDVDTYTILVKEGSPIPHLEKAKLDIWDYKAALKSLTSQDYKKIKQFYNHYDIDIEENSVLILAQNPRYFLARRPVLSPHKNSDFNLALSIGFDLQESSYHKMIPLLLFQLQLVWDVFAQHHQHLYVKWHPRAYLNDGKVKAMTKSENLHSLSTLPADFYQGSDSKKFDKMISFSSTVQSFGDFFNSNEKVALGLAHFDLYLDYFRIIVALRLILEHTQSPKIYASGSYVSQINFILEHYFVTSVRAREFENETIDEHSYLIQGTLSRLLKFPGTTIFFHELNNEVQLENIQTFKLKKKTISGDTFVPLNIEYINFYSSKIRDFLKKEEILFDIEFKNSNVKIEVEALDYFEQNIIASYYIKEMEQRHTFSDLSDKQALVEGLKIVMKRDLETSINEIKNFEAYLLALKELKSQPNILVMFSVKDTAGYRISDVHLSLIKKLGLTSFTNDTWIPYASVFFNEFILESSGVENSATTVVSHKKGLEILVKSEPLRAGNRAEIIVDGIDYAVNQRGVNIVVFDFVAKKLIDSVAFDMHDPEMKVYRR